MKAVSIVLALLLLCSAAHAELLWISRFDNYDTSGGPVPGIVNNTGAPNTMSLLKNFKGEPAFRVADPSVHAPLDSTMTTGNAMQYTRDFTSGDKGNSEISQRELDTYLGTTFGDGAGEHNLFIMSFDMHRSGSSGQNLDMYPWKTGPGSDIDSWTSKDNQHQNYVARRVTWVLNWSTDSILLPTGVTLGTGEYAMYGKDASGAYMKYYSRQSGNNYEDKATLPEVSTGDYVSVEGFGFRSALYGDTVSQTCLSMDNFVIGNSADDVIGQQSILDLNLGTIPTLPQQDPSAVPEPLTLAMLGLGVAGLAARLRRRR